MATINIYLTFDGNCMEAFEFYREAFGGDFPYVGKYSDMPPPEGGGVAFPEEHSDRIMHISLPISKETILMGSDTGGEWAAHFKQGNNFSISITADSKEDADSLFAKLSVGGQVTMPMSSTFWGDYFGQFIDKFGIGWMVSFNENPTQ